MGIDPIIRLIAQDGGGDLIELLVLFIIMAVSALGSILKSKTKKAGKKPPAENQRKKPPTAQPQPTIFPEEPEPPTERPKILTTPDWQTRRPQQQLHAAATSQAKPVSEELGLDPIKLVGATQGSAVTDTAPIDPALSLTQLSNEDLKRAILLKELLGPPRALAEWQSTNI